MILVNGENSRSYESKAFFFGLLSIEVNKLLKFGLITFVNILPVNSRILCQLVKRFGDAGNIEKQFAC